MSGSLSGIRAAGRPLEEATVSAAPLLNVAALPHSAHRQDHGRLREIGLCNQLLHALPAHAEHVSDFSGSHKVRHGSNHGQDATCHLTSGQELRHTSHMTRERMYATSEVEVRFASLVRERGLTFTTDDNVPCGGKQDPHSRYCVPDLLFKDQRVAVFVDGCFWHRCPSHGPSGSAAAAIHAKDAAVNAGLAAHDWQVVRVWEHDDLAQAADALVEVIYDRHADWKAVHMIPGPCRHANSEWCDICSDGPHMPIPNGAGHCERCGFAETDHVDVMMDKILAATDRVVADLLLISRRNNAGRVVGPSEMHEIGIAAARVAEKIRCLSVDTQDIKWPEREAWW